MNNGQRNQCIWLSEGESTQPFDVIVEKVRLDLSTLRGKLHDVERLFPGWSERVDFARGGITCVIVALHDSVEEYKSVRKKNEEKNEHR